jgi:hypothetical protein
VINDRPARDALLRALREEHHPEYWGGERDEAGLVAAFEDEVLAWQRAYIEAHPETGTLDLIEATAKELT